MGGCCCCVLRLRPRFTWPAAVMLGQFCQGIHMHFLLSEQALCIRLPGVKQVQRHSDQQAVAATALQRPLPVFHAMVSCVDGVPAPNPQRMCVELRHCVLLRMHALLCRYAADVLDLIQGATSGQVAGFISETIQGVGGTVPLADGYLPEVYKVRTRHDLA